MRVGYCFSVALLSVLFGFASPARAQEYTYSMEDQTVLYDPADGIGTFDVVVSIDEDPTGASYPTPTIAFEVRIVNDPKYLFAAAVSSVGVVGALNGGAGPAYMSITADDESIYIGAIYSDALDTLALDGPALSITYELIASTFEDNTVGADTELKFDDLEDPSGGERSGNVVLALLPGGGGTFGTPVLVNPEFDHAMITILPKVVEPPPPADPLFLRGDGDGNGVVSALPDALYLLKWGFAGGAAPPCPDAADVDDNGVLSTIGDAIKLLQWSFAGGVTPPDPGPVTCGPDTTDDVLECEAPPAACLP